MPRTSTGSSSPHSRPGDIPGVPHDRGEVQDRLRALGIRPTRGLGQSFLTDPFVGDIEAALLDLPAGRPVTEIGGGLGLLTEALLRRGIGPVTVVERDHRLVGHLRATFGTRVVVVEGDALTVPIPDAQPVVGNLPFSVATPILTRLFELRTPTIVTLLQKEVGGRYAASPGGRQYGRPAIQAALYGSVEAFAPVPASAFEPVPAVDGLIVRFRAREDPLPVPSVPRFERMVAALFQRRRKQLANLLPAVTGGRPEADRFATAAGWPPDWAHRRPEELPPEAFFALARVLGPQVGPLGKRETQAP